MLVHISCLSRPTLSFWDIKIMQIHAAPPYLDFHPGTSCGFRSRSCSPTLGAAMHCPCVLECVCVGNGIFPGNAWPDLSDRFQELVGDSPCWYLSISTLHPDPSRPRPEDADIISGIEPPSPSISYLRYGCLRGGSAIIIDPPPPPTI